MKTYPNSLPEKTEKNTERVSPQPVVHNLQNVPNGMMQTVWFSNPEFPGFPYKR